MQQQQHKRYTQSNELSSLLIGDSHVQLVTGFSIMNNKRNENKIRPWFKR